jgi:hypothetical protein
MQQEQNEEKGGMRMRKTTWRRMVMTRKEFVRKQHRRAVQVGGWNPWV